MKSEFRIHCRPKAVNSGRSGKQEIRREAFTVFELLVVLLVLALLVTLLGSSLARSKPANQSTVCLNNVRRLTGGWRQWSEDNNDNLVTCEANVFDVNLRPAWVSGVLDFSSRPVNYDPAYELAKSPLWPYIGQLASLFRCPADQSLVPAPSGWLPRLRSYSMSQVFSRGEWLDGTYNPVQAVWRIYGKGAEIMRPANTFLFLDEHPDSINDGSFASACTGAEPSDPPQTARLIDYPASFHNGAVALSFADAHAETHQWVGRTIRPPATYGGVLAFNIPAAECSMDLQWLARNTTVRR